MILRRVIEHVKAQNWTAIAIDFVIVVIGVFVGIQLGNVNADLANKRLGESYAKRLIVDLEKDLASSRVQAGYYEEVLRAVKEASALLKDEAADPAALVIAAYRASEIMFIAPNNATWNQIVSSGHLGLLPQSAADSRLADYYAFDSARDIYDFLADAPYRNIARQVIPMEIQAAMREGCSDARDHELVIISFMEECRLDADPGLIAATASALRSDPSIAQALNHQYSNVISATLNLTGNVMFLENALAALKGAPETAQ